MRYDSIFDVVGHIITGPSSSHTAGAARIGFLSRLILGETPINAKISLHGSFAETYRGHGTDKAIIGGLLGFSSDDEKIRQSFEFASDFNLKFEFKKVNLGTKYHQNTAKIELQGLDNAKVTVVGSSIGGGNVIIEEINDLDAGFNADLFTLVCIYKDNDQIAGKITRAITKHNLNTWNMHFSKDKQRGISLLWTEMDSKIPKELVDYIKNYPEILTVRAINV
jgi:L-serine dehydratase